MNELIKISQTKPEVQRKFMAGVYLRMVFALAITAVTAYFVAFQYSTNYSFASFYNRNVKNIILICFIAELTIVFGISFGIRKIKSTTAMLLFILYSITTGLTFSSIFLLFEISSIFKIFVISALMFLGMSIYGAFTKSDLRSFGRYFTMALIGLLVASLLNFFFKSSSLDWLLSILGVGIFVGLTAYDTQKILAISVYDDGSEKFQKFAILGALELYLDFINIFLKMLRLFGKRK